MGGTGSLCRAELRVVDKSDGRLCETPAELNMEGCVTVSLITSFFLSERVHVPLLTGKIGMGWDKGHTSKIS